MTVVKLERNVKDDLEDIIEWLRSHCEDGNVDKLLVSFESKDGLVYERNINLKNKDYIYFLASRISEHFSGEY